MATDTTALTRAPAYPQTRHVRAIVILPDRNSVKPPHDWSGEFRPRALAFAKHHGIPPEDVVQIDLAQPKATRTTRVLSVLAAAGSAKVSPLDCVAFFCHGLHGGLPQFGLGLEDAVPLAGAVASTKSPGLVVAYYACSMAGGPLGGDGGFADKTRDALDAAGSVNCRVYGHATAGSASVNPNCVEFVGSGQGVGGIGGKWVITPGSKDWKPWVRELQRPGSTLWMRFPWMTREEIAHDLAVPA